MVSTPGLGKAAALFNRFLSRENSISRSCGERAGEVCRRACSSRELCRIRSSLLNCCRGYLAAIFVLRLQATIFSRSCSQQTGIAVAVLYGKIKESATLPQTWLRLVPVLRGPCLQHSCVHVEHD